MSPSAFFVRRSRHRKKLEKSTGWHVEAKAEGNVFEADSQLGGLPDQVVIVIDGFLVYLIYFILEMMGIRYEAL
jgi:hypothetical protein